MPHNPGKIVRGLNEIFHSGEQLAHNKFNGKRQWDNHSIAGLNRMFKEAIDDETAFFIEGQKYFFISTSSDKGECDCSFRGTEKDISGNLLPGVRVINSKVILFPDYSGNNMYNSLGNMLVNPNIGMLFIDFHTALRLRVNGTVKIIENISDYIHVWPKALRCVEVNVKQVYWNCPKRIKESVLPAGRY